MFTETYLDRCVLIVDDHADLRETLAEILEEEGYTTAQAANGQEAFDYLQANPLPSLILLDLMMPIMDGWEFRKHQCREPALAEIPVVVVSGADEQEQRAGFREAVAYLTKPVDLSALIDTVSRYCRQTR